MSNLRLFQSALPATAHTGVKANLHSTLSNHTEHFRPLQGEHILNTMLFGQQTPPPQKQLPVTHEYQGDTNGCGTTSLSMALNTLLCLKKQPAQFSRSKLDQGNREFNSYSAIQVLQQAAKSNGFYAEIYTNLSFERITQHITAEQPVIALINPVKASLKDDSALHYVVIDGYERKADGSEHLHISDPGLPLPRGSSWIPFDTFKTDYWQTKTWRGIPLGTTQMGLVVSNTNTLPAGEPLNLQFQMAASASNALNAVAGWMNGWLG